MSVALKGCGLQRSAFCISCILNSFCLVSAIDIISIRQFFPPAQLACAVSRHVALCPDRKPFFLFVPFDSVWYGLICARFPTRATSSPEFKQLMLEFRTSIFCILSRCLALQRPASPAWWKLLSKADCRKGSDPFGWGSRPAVFASRGVCLCCQPARGCLSRQKALCCFFVPFDSV